MEQGPSNLWSILGIPLYRVHSSTRQGKKLLIVINRAIPEQRGNAQSSYCFKLRPSPHVCTGRCEPWVCVSSPSQDLLISRILGVPDNMSMPNIFRKNLESLMFCEAPQEMISMPDQIN